MSIVLVDVSFFVFRNFGLGKVIFLVFGKSICSF